MNAGRVIANIIKVARLDLERYGHIDGKVGLGHDQPTDLVDASSMARKLGYDNPGEEVQAFFDSRYYRDLCELAGLEPDAIKKEIIGGLSEYRRNDR